MSLRIRAHHLLCMLGFRGVGYSEAFVRNMRAVVDAFLSESPPPVQVVAEPDAICSACPHLQDGECRVELASDEAVRRRDEAVLGRLGLGQGDRLSSSFLMRLVAERIDASALTEICGGCRWLSLGYCADGLRRLRGGPGAGAPQWGQSLSTERGTR